MATPQETRFLRLALTRKLLTKDQLKTALTLQQQKAEGGSSIPLWDCAVLEGQMDQGVAEALEDDAGDLAVEKLGEFILVRKLGEGGMGSVWLAVDSARKKYAVKLLPPHLAKQRQYLTRFFREAQACIKLEHENIIRGMVVEEDQGRYYFAMEFIDGRSVRDMMEEVGAIEADEASNIILQVAHGLGYAHEHGFVHRDIKPDNIMLTKFGVAKVADLGLARQVDSEMTALTRTGTGMGTPYYMAPEQSTDAKRVDARADIYSLGCTWYHMVTGQLPFSGDSAVEILQKHLKEPVKSPQTLKPGLPRGVSLVIERMLAKDPANRVQTCAELAKLIEEQCLGERDITRELGLAERDAAGQMWEVRIPVQGKLDRRRMTLDDLKRRIRKGSIDRDTPARRAGSHEWSKAVSFKELLREFPSDYAVTAQGKVEAPADSARSEMKTLMGSFDQAKKRHDRKKAAKNRLPLIIEAIVVLAVMAAVIVFWSDIIGLAYKLMGQAPALAP